MTASTEPTFEYIPGEPFLSPVELATQIGVTAPTVTLWLRDPSHPLWGVKIGTMWRIPMRSVKAFLEGKYGNA